MGERVRPFTGSSKFFDWKRRNCGRCTLKWEVGRGYQCDVETALDYAYMDDDPTVSQAIGKLLKFDGEHVAEDCQRRELEEANVDSTE